MQAANPTQAGMMCKSGTLPAASACMDNYTLQKCNTNLTFNTVLLKSTLSPDLIKSVLKVRLVQQFHTVQLSLQPLTAGKCSWTFVYTLGLPFAASCSVAVKQIKLAALRSLAYSAILS